MSIQATYDPDNIFAKIIRGEMPCVKLYEDENVLAFMDVFPQSEGHCLVVHKKAKATNLFDIGADDLNALTIVMQKIGQAVADGLSPDGIRIAQFNGEPAGQTVFHLHFHIIPVYERSKLGRHASGGPVDGAILEPVAEKIRVKL